MLIKKRLKQLQQLSFFEIKIFLISIFLLPLLALSLKVKGLNWTQKTLSKFTGEGQCNLISQHDQMLYARKVSRMVSAAANHGFYSANCLKKSLLTWWLLGRRGITTDLKIGVNKEMGDFNAHAWVEYRGNVLIDVTDIEDRFSAFGSH